MTPVSTRSRCAYCRTFRYGGVSEFGLHFCAPSCQSAWEDQEIRKMVASSLQPHRSRLPIWVSAGVIVGSAAFASAAVGLFVWVIL